MKKISCIYGTGGFGREAYLCLYESFQSTGIDMSKNFCFIDDNKENIGKEIMGLKVISRDSFDSDIHSICVAVGDPVTRKAIVNSLPKETTFFSIIHHSVYISPWVNIGEGAIITAGTILTCNISIGDHCHLNLNTTIGHDCVIGDYFTTAPGVNISGSCEIADKVYFGTSSSIRQGIKVCKNSTIGMGAIVVKDINEAGVYVGSPAKLLKK